MRGARSRLYAKLPLLTADRWWLDLAATRGRVLELGAGGGRLTAGFLRAGCQVTAVERDPDMVRLLRDRLGSDVEVEVHDVVGLPDGPAADLVALPSSLLNELPGPEQRRAALAGAARRCRPDGRVALHLLGPWWLAQLQGRSVGQLEPSNGDPPIEVTIDAAMDEQGFDPWSGRRQAHLTYRFADGTVLYDDLDAAIVTPFELERLCADAGLEVTGRYGAHPPTAPGPQDPAWHLVTRPIV